MLWRVAGPPILFDPSQACEAYASNPSRGRLVACLVLGSGGWARVTFSARRARQGGKACEGGGTGDCWTTNVLPPGWFEAIVVLEAPTSKIKVIHDWLKMQPNWPTNHSLWIPAGSRLDFLSAAMAAIQKAFPARFPFVVQYGANTQSARTRPD